MPGLVKLLDQVGLHAQGQTFMLPGSRVVRWRVSLGSRVLILSAWGSQAPPAGMIVG